MRAALEFQEDWELLAEEEREDRRSRAAWIEEGALRRFANPISALMRHSEVAEDAQKQRFEEQSMVYQAAAPFRCTRMPPLPEGREEIAGPRATDDEISGRPTRRSSRRRVSARVATASRRTRMVSTVQHRVGQPIRRTARHFSF